MAMTKQGFTLAELLIAVVILGIIATFTIPKVLVSKQKQDWIAGAKETAGTLSSAYQLYQQNHTVTAATGPNDLMPYINYVKLETATLIDHSYGNLSIDCSSAGLNCYRLHNGAILNYNTANRFGTLDNNHFIYWEYDPDGKYSGTTNGPGKCAVFELFYNGRLIEAEETSTSYFTNYGAGDSTWPAVTSDWFSWN